MRLDSALSLRRSLRPQTNPPRLDIPLDRAQLSHSRISIVQTVPRLEHAHLGAHSKRPHLHLRFIIRVDFRSKKTKHFLFSVHIDKLFVERGYRSHV